MSDKLSEEELQALHQFMNSSGYDKGVWSFFNQVLASGNTVKVSNLNMVELEQVRTLLSAAQYADLMGLNLVESFFRTQAEIITSSSDSKDGFLIRSAITMRKESKMTTGQSSEQAEKKKRSWSSFKKQI